jgi:hypothetical protein
MLSMKRLVVLVALLAGCGPSAAHSIDLTGCYTSTLTATQRNGPPSVVHGHTFCAGSSIYDSYQGAPSEGEMRIDESREVEFDDHNTIHQHFVGHANANEADITDFVELFEDGVLRQSWLQVFEYRDVVRVSGNP